MALRWLLAHPGDCPLLLVGPSIDAARALVRLATLQRAAAFGWSVDSVGTLAARLSAIPLAAQGFTLATPLVLEAVCVRVLSELEAGGKLGRLSKISDRPGLPRALLRTFGELRLAGVPASLLDSELRDAYALYQSTLSDLSLADRARMFEAATAAARATNDAPLGQPLCLYDLSVRTELERVFLEAVTQRAPDSFVTLPSNDPWSKRALATCSMPNTGSTSNGEPEMTVDPRELITAPASLRRLQAELFSTTSAGEMGEMGDAVSILSAPGESRESVEIVRRLLAEADRGVPFDRMAILLRSPFHYRSHLLEALRRASVPAVFSQQASRPDPSGRAFLLLLECAAEGLPATRFAEYLSLGVSPALGARGISPTDAPEHAPSKRVSVPPRWESLLVDAAVIGGAERWRRRLAGLSKEVETRSQSAHEVDASIARRDLESLRELSAFTLPVIELLASLPKSATWGAWLGALETIAHAAIEDPQPILSVLGELAILRDVGPVTLTAVRAVLDERLGQIALPRLTRGGGVLVASVDEARGQLFDVVFVPGLAEKLFPQRVLEDPLLSDQKRALISPLLEDQSRRVANERAALAVAVGAARQRVVLSYPRFESDKARPRVPSFYALEAVRAAEGRLPGFTELSRRADQASKTRMGWPAPEHAADAIDASEYDLAVLHAFLLGSQKEIEGAAHYLLTASERLRRALQFRARRWRPEWRSVDGLVEPSALARAALDARLQTLTSRGFAVTALEKYATCPYRFYLSTVVGLGPRKAIADVEELDPVTRGLLVHELLHAVGSELHRLGLFSEAGDAAAASAVVNRVVEQRAEKWRDDLAPAIPRVWQDAIEEIRLDALRWAEQAREGAWLPLQFEHRFGYSEAGGSSTDGPVLLSFGLPLRGAIDIIEQRGDTLRASDYKTGIGATEAAVVGGGSFLQPLLYALVLEKLFPEHGILGGNAYYCTSRGGFKRTEVELNDGTRAAATEVHLGIASAFAQGFFPAAPAAETCEQCNYRKLCGPYERERVARKDPARLEFLSKLRGLR